MYLWMSRNCNENSFAAVPRYELMGDLWMRRAQIEKAVAAYKRSLKINSAQLRVRKKLISIYKLLRQMTLRFSWIMVAERMMQSVSL